MKTGEDFKRAAKEHSIDYWHIRDCSICDYELCYLFNYKDHEVVFDAGCSCVRNIRIHVRDWKDVANHYNLNINNSTIIEEYNKFWKFDKESK